MCNNIQTVGAKKNRLFYIDALRGFAIVLVIIGHLPAYSFWGWGKGISTLGPMVGIFHMPLFMMISGYVTNINTLNLQRKAKLLIPFFVFGILFILYFGSTITDFITSEPKAGYWFLWAIFVFYVFIFIIKQTKCNLLLGMIGVEILFMTLHFLLRRTIPGTTLSTDHLWNLWPYFSLGILLRGNLFQKILNKSLPIFIVNIILIIIIKYVLSITSGEAALKLIGSIMAFPICINLLLAFYYLEEWFKGKQSRCKTLIKKIGNDIGTNTLQIYVIHYFILMTVPLKPLGTYLLEHNIVFLEYIISPIFAVIISYICIFIAKLIYKVKLGFVFGR